MPEKMEIEDPASERWHLDKRVPIALIAALMLQFAGVVAWGTQMTARVSQLEQIAGNFREDRDRLIRIETDVTAIDRRLERMEDRLLD